MKSYLELFDVFGAVGQKRFRTAERALSTVGFNHTEARLLMLLGQNDGATQDDLSAQLFVDRSNAGRSLKRLETDGYVERKRDSQDRRTNTVFITKKGLAATRKIAKIRDAIAHELFQALSENEAETVLRLLRRVSENAQDSAI